MSGAAGTTLLDRWLSSGREVAVVGLGKSGVAATRLLRRLGIPVYASDSGSGAAQREWARALEPVGAEVQIGGHDLERIGRAAAVVVAPGVPPEVPALEAAIMRAVGVYADKGRWRQMMLNAMSRDYSWGAAAAQYRDLYEGLLGRSPQPASAPSG